MGNAQFWIETLALWHPLKSAFAFVWGAGDPVWLLVLKRTFLIMPLGAAAIGYWTSVLAVPSIVVRQKRRTFVGLVLVTWWDLARATFTFWGGAFRFLMRLGISVLGFAQMLLVGTWAIVQELIVNDKVNIIAGGITPTVLSYGQLVTQAKMPTVVMISGASA